MLVLSLAWSWPFLFLLACWAMLVVTMLPNMTTMPTFCTRLILFRSISASLYSLTLLLFDGCWHYPVRDWRLQQRIGSKGTCTWPNNSLSLRNSRESMRVIWIVEHVSSLPCRQNKIFLAIYNLIVLSESWAWSAQAWTRFVLRDF